MENTKDELTKLFEIVFQSLGASGVEIVFSQPENAEHGDYSTNVAFSAAKSLKKSPKDLALQAKEILSRWISRVTSGDHILTYVRGDQTISISPAVFNVLQDISRVEMAGAGFINVFFSEAKLSTHLTGLLKLGKSDGASYQSSAFSRQKVLVEFTDPNPFKEFHIGHLYSNAVGESLSRLLEFQGYNVKRADYFGDVGMHVAKVIWGMREEMENGEWKMENGKSNIKKGLNEIGGKPIGERIKWMGRCYAMGATAYEENSEAKKEIATINRLVYITSQHQLEKGKPFVDYVQNEEIDKVQLAEIERLYATGRAWSMEYFESIFQRLGTKFDYYYPESVVGEIGYELVMEGLKKGVFEKSDNAVIFRGEKEGLHTRVFINSLGLPTYETKELGLAVAKYQDFPYDLSLCVTGKEIDEYFRVLMAALGKVKPDLAKKTKHIGHGMVRLPTGKMSSRTGSVLTGEWLLEEVKKKITDIVDKSTTKDINEYKTINKDDIVEKATIAAIKYAFLRVSLPGDISFDIEKSVSFDGDSGPYLLYTYARCKSVLRKWRMENGEWKMEISQVSINTEEREVARELLYFTDVVRDAAERFSPGILCTYLFRLASVFNVFYAKHRIAESPFRLVLTEATANVLAKGLYLLGIETVEQM